MNIELETLDETEHFAAALWNALPPNYLIFLHGQLGAGKTTLVRSLLRAAGYQGAVKSPTYTLVEEYEINQQKIFHFDLYRIADPEELELIGIRDYMEEQSICFIEWAELGENFLPEPDLVLNFRVEADKRILKLSKKSQKTIELKWKNNNLLL
ncbi:MAG: tRNA (adenosine(37)-N6)-threonylcarbamoyltransferase complex ATPase subunit type 1 TsaE [Methylococcales bacterium]|nr:tRNA (adenosine(37)-N6)-threonylcarbamoyltransferase complex ATPase subunit type 1 TsaE [Methylococcales bacterium]